MTSSAHSMFERRLHALVVGSALLAMALVLTIAIAVDRVDSLVQAADDQWLEWMIDIETAPLTRVAEVLSVLGGPFVMVPLRVAVIAVLGWRRRWLQLGAFLGATITSELCIGPLKALIDRPRPPGSLITTDSASFPSGHAIAASVTSLGLVVVLAPIDRRWKWTAAAATFAALMAMSRTYLRAHWATDVIAGACIGTGLAIVWSAALEMERSRRQRRVRGPGAPPESDRATVLLSEAGRSLLAIGSAAVVLLHVLRRDLDPTGHRLSEYAVGRYGWVMTTSFLTIGAGLVAIGLAWWRQPGPPRSVGPAPLVVVVAGLGMIVSGIFPTNVDRPGSTAEAIHSRASALATVALIAAAVMSSVRHRAPEPSSRPDLLDALALTAVVLGVLSPVLHHSAWSGLSQRSLWLVLLVWTFVIAARTVRRSAGPRSGRRAEAGDVSDLSVPSRTMTT